MVRIGRTVLARRTDDQRHRGGDGDNGGWSMSTLQLQARALGDPTRHEIFRFIADAARPVEVVELTEPQGWSSRWRSTGSRPSSNDAAIRPTSRWSRAHPRRRRWSIPTPSAGSEGSVSRAMPPTLSRRAPQPGPSGCAHAGLVSPSRERRLKARHPEPNTSWKRHWTAPQRGSRLRW